MDKTEHRIALIHSAQVSMKKECQVLKILGWNVQDIAGPLRAQFIKLQQLRPDIVIVDTGTTLELADINPREIRQRIPEVKIVMAIVDKDSSDEMIGLVWQKGISTIRRDSGMVGVSQSIETLLEQNPAGKENPGPSTGRERSV